MLVLARKVDEVIRIGDQVVVRVLAVKDGQVKLGIEAPRSTRVLRGELYEAVQQQNAAAAKADPVAISEAAARLTQLKLGGPGTKG